MYWYPTTCWQTYFTHKKNLRRPAYSHGNHALLESVPGFGKTLAILSGPWQAFFPRLPQKGKETIRKYTAGNRGSKKRVPAGLRQPGYPAVATPLTLLWVGTNKSDDRY